MTQISNLPLKQIEVCVIQCVAYDLMGVGHSGAIVQPFWH
jgi:hypothetical protein